MNSDMYTILSMAARYFFAGLMVLIVYRAWRITARDNRRARVLRDLSPETGCVGELLVNPKNKRRQTLPIPREGVLGSSRKADIRLKYKDVLPAHAQVEEREGGLLIRPLGKARIALGEGGFSGEQLFARDGDVLTIGKHRLMIVLFDPAAKQAARDADAQRSDCASRETAAGAAPPYDGADEDDFFDEDKLWLDDEL